jgi:hypothetical protein
MSIRTKLLLSAAALSAAGLVALGFTFYFSDDKDETSPQLPTLSQDRTGLPKNIASATDNTSAMSSLSANPSHSSSRRADAMSLSYGAGASDSGDRESESIRNSTAIVDQSRATASQHDLEVYWPHVPLAFINHEGVLPETKEVATALQSLQQDFVKATGADTANPSDPSFGQIWEWAQPTADERFYALFGQEAFNAMSIMEARQRGHF